MYCRRWLLAMDLDLDEESSAPAYRLWLQNLDDDAQSFRVGTLEELLEVLLRDWDRAASPLADHGRLAEVLPHYDLLPSD